MSEYSRSVQGNVLSDVANPMGQAVPAVVDSAVGLFMGLSAVELREARARSLVDFMASLPAEVWDLPVSYEQPGYGPLDPLELLWHIEQIRGLT